MEACLLFSLPRPRRTRTGSTDAGRQAELRVCSHPTAPDAEARLALEALGRATLLRLLPAALGAGKGTELRGTGRTGLACVRPLVSVPRNLPPVSPTRPGSPRLESEGELYKDTGPT